MALARTNLTLPEDLIRQVDELAGPRGRSRFVADAVAYRVKREKLRRAIELTRGCMLRNGKGMTRDEVTAWVRAQRDAETD